MGVRGLGKGQDGKNLLPLLSAGGDGENFLNPD